MTPVSGEEYTLRMTFDYTANIWHIPHPSLVAVRRKGKSHALKVFVRGDEGILHFF